ncbi:Carbonic anhydrase [Wickerhamiella sorbophila]|uniref:Carbonic anhydrase n=1 Tax=Wickerhamiella sorbophila TaxID=45607 RepID=A0A2T0FGJ1_9ASCO|nr:Carbonic anhydrase [Wickerhamiella sorbophila]PRT54100.1 Carbonic anhydrase [Wickerhamiella sorbophila]
MCRSPFRFSATDGVDKLLKLNKEWAKRLDQANPGLLEANAKGQKPQILWIGCADSRSTVASLDLLPGEVFVHRNVANMVPNCDPSSQSLIQLAMEVVGVKHIIVCGHTDCKGVETTLNNARVGGSLEAWLRNLRDVRAKYKTVLEAIPSFKERAEKLAELNVIEQVWNVKTNDIVREHMAKRGVQVYGMIYDVATGLLHQVDVPEDPDVGYYAVD